MYSSEFEINFVEEPSNSKMKLIERLDVLNDGKESLIKDRLQSGIYKMSEFVERPGLTSTLKTRKKKIIIIEKNRDAKFTPISLNVKQLVTKRENSFSPKNKLDYTTIPRNRKILKISTLNQTDVGTGIELLDLVPWNEPELSISNINSRQVITRQSTDPFEDTFYYLKGRLNLTKSPKSPNFPSLNKNTRPMSLTPTKTDIKTFRNRSITPKNPSLYQDLYNKSLKHN